MPVVTAHIARRVARRWVAREFPSQEAMEAYLDEHPNASKEKHWVRDPEPDDNGKSDPDDDKGEADKGNAEPEDEGKGEKADVDPAKHKPSEEQLDFVGKGSDHAVQRVVNDLAAGKKPTVADIPRGLALITKALTRTDVSKAEIAQLRQLEEMFEELAGNAPDRSNVRAPKVRVPRSDFSDQALALADKHRLKPTHLRDVKQHVGDVVKKDRAQRFDSDTRKAMERNGFDEGDLDDLRRFAERAREKAESKGGKAPTAAEIRKQYTKDNPDYGKVSDRDFEALLKPPKKSKSVADLRKDFLGAVKDADLKDAVKAMTAKEFEELLESLEIGVEGGGRSRGRGRRGSILRVAAAHLAGRGRS